MTDSCVIELHLDALRTNIAFLKTHLGPDVILSSVVKGNAYGHGIREFTGMAADCGVTHFSVFSADEALSVRDVTGSDATILIMGDVEGDSLAWAIEHGIEFYVFDTDRLEAAIRIAKTIGIPARIHLEVETGMNRTGFPESDLPRILKMIQDEARHIDFRGLCTHYAGAETITNHERVRSQIERFHDMSQQVADVGLTPALHHSACSAASVMFPETHMDMVRIGIMQYGLWSSPETFANHANRHHYTIDPLRRVIAWKSRILNIKHVQGGEYIGYGDRFITQHPMRLAVIPVGYSHGYSRVLSNQGRVLIRETHCPVVGTVNMNMFVVDVTDVPDADKGDEVVLIGTQGSQSVSIASFSEFSNQLNYELLTRLPHNIRRVVV
jgi:alanine racemase